MRPYYLFHCDPVVGAGHFRTSVWKGLEIMEGLRGHMSGLGVPTYVVDGMHGAGKIPLMPNYLVSAQRKRRRAAQLRGLARSAMPRKTGPDGKPPSIIPSLGVSNLLSGNMGALVPEDTPRYQRRQDQADLHVVDAADRRRAAFRRRADVPGDGHPRAKVVPRQA